VMAGDLVLLAAFFAQAHSAAPVLHEVVAHLHLKHGVDAGEAVDHHYDERKSA
jgi:predicted small metal-binding protein